MEFFTKSKAVKLRSHLDKYLIAGDDKETVQQSGLHRRGGKYSPAAIWIVEIVEEKSQTVRLKSCHGRYLNASDSHFLLGVTGKKVLQTERDPKLLSWTIKWEPIRDGFQVRLKSWCGSYLRANGGTRPWRNSITHDEPHRSATKDWVLWDVEVVDDRVSDLICGSVSVMGHLWPMSSFSSLVSEEVDSDQGSGSSKWVVQSKSISPRLPLFQANSSSQMDLFHKAKSIRLRSHHHKYLLADDDEESVTQDRNGSSKNARWTIETVPGSGPVIFRFKSCYGKYLTASNQPSLLGVTGSKVLQTLPNRLDSSVQWEPVRDRTRFKLKTQYGNFLRANGGLPPWRNSVTHDIPHRTSTQDWILWEVDVVEIQVQSPVPLISYSDSLDFDTSSHSSVSVKSELLDISSDFTVNSPSPKSEGRIINYCIADDNGEVDDDDDDSMHLKTLYSFAFRGNGVGELTHELEEETGLEGIIVCTRSPLNQNLYPLRLQLPPNNVAMNVVVVLKSSVVGRNFEKLGS